MVISVFLKKVGTLSVSMRTQTTTKELCKFRRKGAGREVRRDISSTDLKALWTAAWNPFCPRKLQHTDWALWTAQQQLLLPITTQIGEEGRRRSQLWRLGKLLFFLQQFFNHFQLSFDCVNHLLNSAGFVIRWAEYLVTLILTIKNIVTPIVTINYFPSVTHEVIKWPQAVWTVSMPHGSTPLFFIGFSSDNFRLRRDCNFKVGEEAG